MYTMMMMLMMRETSRTNRRSLAGRPAAATENTWEPWCRWPRRPQSGTWASAESDSHSAKPPSDYRIPASTEDAGAWITNRIENAKTHK